jgi:hypothetical protein
MNPLLEAALDLQNFLDGKAWPGAAQGRRQRLPHIVMGMQSGASLTRPTLLCANRRLPSPSEFPGSP